MGRGLGGVGGEVGGLSVYQVALRARRGSRWKNQGHGEACPPRSAEGGGQVRRGVRVRRNSKGPKGLCAAPELSGRTVVGCQDPAGGAWMKWACGRNLQSYWRAASAQTGGLRWDGEARLRRWRLGLVASGKQGQA